MSDKLSAASLLLTAVAIIYSLWYPELAKALKLKPKPQKADNRDEYKEVRQIFSKRALPLFCISACLIAIFTPDSVSIVRGVLRTLSDSELMARSAYDAVAASFVAVTALILLLTLHLGGLTLELGRLRGRLNPDR